MQRKIRGRYYRQSGLTIGSARAFIVPELSCRLDYRQQLDYSEQSLMEGTPSELDYRQLILYNHVTIHGRNYVVGIGSLAGADRLLDYRQNLTIGSLTIDRLHCIYVQNLRENARRMI